MKKFTLVLALILIGQFVLAQTLSLSDMISLAKCETFSCFNDYLVAKGFSYSEKSDYRGYNFISDEIFTVASKNGTTFPCHNLMSFNCKGERHFGVILAYITSKKNEYNSLIKDLKQKEFFESSTSIQNDENKSLITKYKSDKISNIFIEVIINVSPLDNGDSQNSYLVMVSENYR